MSDTESNKSNKPPIKKGKAIPVTSTEESLMILFQELYKQGDDIEALKTRMDEIISYLKILTKYTKGMRDFEQKFFGHNKKP